MALSSRLAARRPVTRLARAASSAAAPFLRRTPPMGIYETLYAFQDGFGCPMGDPGTRPWSQGFPLTTQIPGGPPLPTTVSLDWKYLRYPKAWGLPALREKLAEYYQTHYGARISPENVMVFAGGRPALISTLMFLEKDVEIRIASTEYTPYYDMLERLSAPYSLLHSGEDNGFHPANAEYVQSVPGKRTLGLLSNPCNPTGVTRSGTELEELVRLGSSRPDVGLFVDEAYELFHDKPVSALQFVEDIDQTNIFVTGAVTKGFQSPGIRIGWCVASRANIETLGNFSSFGMGGVSHPSQLFAMQLLEEGRVQQAREAVPAFYASQRRGYGEAFQSLGFELFTGEGGFYHWMRIPGGLTAEELNARLFRRGAAILRGTDCDMERLGTGRSPLDRFCRFSFGPLKPEDFEQDVEILRAALAV